MSQFTLIILYKVICLLVGVLAIILGYRLFMKGYVEKQCELEAGDGKRQFRMSQVAPGIYFCAFGTFIIMMSIFKGVTLTSGVKGDSSTQFAPAGDPLETISGGSTMFAPATTDAAPATAASSQ